MTGKPRGTEGKPDVSRGGGSGANRHQTGDWKDSERAGHIADHLAKQAAEKDKDAE